MVSRPNYVTFPMVKHHFCFVIKATPKTKNHKNSMGCALLAPLHLETHFVHTIPWNDVPLLFKCSPKILIWTASSEFGTYRLCEQRRFRRACASAQCRQNLRCSLIQAVSREDPSERKPDPWPLWMAGHAQLKFVMTECSKTQNRLTGLI